MLGYMGECIHNETMQCNAMQCNAMQCNAMQCNAMQYNTIELYCPVNGKFVYSVRVKVNKNTIVIKKKNK